VATVLLFQAPPLSQDWGGLKSNNKIKEGKTMNTQEEPNIKVDGYMKQVLYVLVGINCLMFSYTTIIPMLLETKTVTRIMEVIDIHASLLDLYSGANHLVHRVDIRLIKIVIDAFNLITGKIVSD
jgi:hypothetical protein